MKYGLWMGFPSLIGCLLLLAPSPPPQTSTISSEELSNVLQVLVQFSLLIISPETLLPRRWRPKPPDTFYTLSHRAQHGIP